MHISVVIPTYNSEPQLRLLLSSLNHVEIDPSDSIEVVVVDDGSDDGTRQMVTSVPTKFALRYEFLPRTATSGRSAARNAGFAVATGELVIMVDAHKLVSPTFVEEHARYHRLRKDLVVVGPERGFQAGSIDAAALAERFTFDALPPLGWRDLREQLLDEFSGNLNQMATCWHHLFSCNASVRREHLTAVGGFDEAYSGWGLEDSDLGYRLRGQGLAFAFNAAAVIYNQRGRHVDANRYAQWRRNLEYMIGKYGTPEIALQTVICPALDSADRSYDWLEAMRRLEFGARALAGRLPRPTTFQLVEVGTADVPETLASLGHRSAAADLVVVDHTPNADLAGPVQCLDTDRELLYFHRPSPERWREVRQRYVIAD